MLVFLKLQNKLFSGIGAYGNHILIPLKDAKRKDFFRIAVMEESAASELQKSNPDYQRCELSDLEVILQQTF
jgi:hypothetical protein